MRHRRLPWIAWTALLALLARRSWAWRRSKRTNTRPSTRTTPWSTWARSAALRHLNWLNSSHQHRGTAVGGGLTSVPDPICRAVDSPVCHMPSNGARASLTDLGTLPGDGNSFAVVDQ